MITADQFLCHLIGDYILQSDWMAQNKTKANRPALVHAFVYSLCFVPLLDWRHRTAIGSFLVIFSTHFFIDRYRLARYVVWAKNWIAPAGNNPPFEVCAATGYPPDRPAWMAVWLLIIADNVIHITINGLALLI